MGCLLAYSAASLCALGMLTCCTCVVRPQSVGPGISWAFCLSFALQVALVLRVPGVLFSSTIHTLRDGVSPAGSRLVCPRSERRCSVFSFPFGLFLHVSPALRDAVTVWVRCWLGTPADSRGCCNLFSFVPLSEASLRTLSYRCVSWWSSLRPRVFGYP